MTHQEAVVSQAVERYVLEELSAAENEAFELHYFECSECAAAVEDGMQFRENARAVLAQTPAQVPAPESHPNRASFWERWLDLFRMPAFAAAAVFAAAMGGVAVYEGAYLLPAARQMAAQAQPAFAIPLAGASRGAVEEVAVPRGTGALVFSIALPPDVHNPSYRWTLSEDGRKVSEASLPAPASGQSLLVTVPTSKVSTGNYEITIYGTDSSNRIGDKIDIYRTRLRVP